MWQGNVSTLKEILVVFITNPSFLINYFLKNTSFFLWSEIEVSGMETDKGITELCSYLYNEESSKCRPIRHIIYMVSWYCFA